MSLQGVSHANRFQLQEKEEQKMTKEICGLPLAKLSKSSNQNLPSWKTCQGFFQVDISRASYRILHKSGMMQNGVIYRHRIVERHTKGKDCGLWQTPNVVDSTGRQYQYVGKDRKKFLTLPGQVKQWPTPRQFMHKDSEVDRNKGNLGEKVQGQLSPDWVAWLMGWPFGWESLEPMTEMIWLDWSVDPADLKKPKEMPTPVQYDATPGGPNNHYKGIGNNAKHGRMKPGTGPIPRVATGIKDRVNRLKALGNGQVPLCAAKAWKILTN